jgi:hypothetical protein
MPTPSDAGLYEEAKDFIMSKYKKNSPYASGAVVKHYKGLFKKKYGEDTPPYREGGEKKLERYFKEKWVSVNPVVGLSNADAYAVFRPTVKVNSKTPELLQDSKKKDLREKVKLKQKYKGDRNLPTFGGMIVQSFPNHPDNN